MCAVYIGRKAKAKSLPKIDNPTFELEPRDYAKRMSPRTNQDSGFIEEIDELHYLPRKIIEFFLILNFNIKKVQKLYKKVV